MEKRLGKIEAVYFGLGGYQEAMLGVHFTLSGCAWGVNDSKCAWDAETINCSEYAKWTEEDRSFQYDEIMRFVSKLLSQAKVRTISELKGKPIEATFDGTLLKKWRILEEVL